MGVQEIKSQAEFDALLASGNTFFIDFYADWCGPCKVISPVFDQLAGEPKQAGVEFYKLNIDNIPEVAQALGIRSIPTFHAFKGGVRVDQLVGANRSELVSLVERHSSV